MEAECDLVWERETPGGYSLSGASTFPCVFPLETPPGLRDEEPRKKYPEALAGRGEK